MDIKKRTLFGLTAIFILLAGCSSNQLAERGKSALTYDAVIAEKSKAVGLEALIGGEIIALQLENGKTRVEIINGVIGKNGYPDTRTASINQRAMIIVDKPLSTIDNQIGDKILSFGVVTNVEEVLLGGQKMSIVLLKANEYTFWNQPDLSIYDYRYRSRPGYIANRYAEFGFRRSDH